MNISSIDRFAGKTLAKTTKLFAKSVEKGSKEPIKYAAKLLVYSFVSKDAIGCVFYTYQSYNNKRIPEDKRKFIALMDLFNGIVNVGGQLLSAKLVDNLLTPKLKDRYTTSNKAVFSPDNITNQIAGCLKNEKEAMAAKIKGVNPEELLKDKKGFEELCKDSMKKFGQSSGKGKDIVTGLGILVATIATNAFIKRTMSPLIATSLAAKFSNDKGKKNKADTVEKQQPEVKKDDAQANGKKVKRCF